MSWHPSFVRARGFRCGSWALPVLLLALAAPAAPQDSWTLTSTVGAPAARSGHTAVWMGSRMIVWGGPPSPGALYDPGDGLLDTRVHRGSTHRAQRSHGGLDGPGCWSWVETQVPRPYSGGVDDPATNTWEAMTDERCAERACRSHRGLHGQSDDRLAARPRALPRRSTTRAGVYDPATDSWTPTSTSAAPTARHRYTAVWTGSRMIVWGGSLSSRVRPHELRRDLRSGRGRLDGHEHQRCAGRAGRPHGGVDGFEDDRVGWMVQLGRSL